MLSAYTDLGMSGNPKEGQWWNDDRAWESTIHTHTQKGEQQEEKWGCTLGFYPTGAHSSLDGCLWVPFLALLMASFCLFMTLQQVYWGLILADSRAQTQIKSFFWLVSEKLSLQLLSSLDKMFLNGTWGSSLKSMIVRKMKAGRCKDRQLNK